MILNKYERKLLKKIYSVMAFLVIPSLTLDGRRFLPDSE